MQRLQHGLRSQPPSACQRLRRSAHARHAAELSGKRLLGLPTAGHAHSRDLRRLKRAAKHRRSQPEAGRQPSQCSVDACRTVVQRAAATVAALAVSVGALWHPGSPAASAVLLRSDVAAAVHSAQRHVGPSPCRSSAAGADVGVLARDSTAYSTARRLSRSQLRQIDLLDGSTAQVIRLCVCGARGSSSRCLHSCLRMPVNQTLRISPVALSAGERVHAAANACSNLLRVILHV